jgi:3,4-dihydroxy-2-butanone 4-phosphate synthase
VQWLCWHRENEGDLICAGSLASEDLLAFMIRYTSGVICVSLEGHRLEELALPPMVSHITISLYYTAILHTVHGVLRSSANVRLHDGCTHCAQFYAESAAQWPQTANPKANSSLLV